MSAPPDEPPNGALAGGLTPHDRVPDGHVAIVGGGPAGLMAAERLAAMGLPVVVYEARPSLGRKFLRAGIGGLNLTHAEDYASFCMRFGERQPVLQAALDAFPPQAVRDWAAGLGVDTFIGSSGRVFPVDMKAAPLLRAQIQRLRAAGVGLLTRHRWLGWDDTGALRFETRAKGPGAGGHVITERSSIVGARSSSVHQPAPQAVEARLVRPRATVLALGGGSWPQLGSDGAWVPWLQARGVEVAPLLSSNCGFEVAWSAHLCERHAGSHVKSVSLCFTDLHGQEITQQGEFVITEHGIEGSLIYAHAQRLREAVMAQGQTVIFLDLLPGRSHERVLADVRAPRGARSLSSHLQSKLNLRGVKVALLREVLGAQAYTDPLVLARAIKALPITLRGVRPLAEAISSAGGVRFDSVDEWLMLNAMPGVFVAGEMLDWEAPTGGYLLTACLAQGARVAEGVRRWLDA